MSGDVQQKWNIVLLQILLILILILMFPYYSHAYVGSAASYKAPYIPTACYGKEESGFPANRLFAAAGEGIWENGAACGRQYLVTCLSAPAPTACVPGSIILVKVVDRAATARSSASTDGAALVLSVDAFSRLVDPPTADFINISYRQVA
ncbi:hypothetical protein vseg_008833 [Gypsophila vaccaria]